MQREALDTYFSWVGQSDWSKSNSWADVGSLTYQETYEFPDGSKEKRYKAYVTLHIYDKYDDFLHKRKVTIVVSDDPKDLWASDFEIIWDY